MTTLKSINRNTGFTLVEMIVVIVIAGIIAGMVAVFIRSPVEGYIDAQRRAELTDVADTAVRRMARDIRSALPNSVRTSDDGSGLCVEFMPTKIGARYRAVKDGGGNGDVLDFTLDTAPYDASFDMLWLNSALPSESRINEGDVVVVYNDGSATGNAYSGLNAIQVATSGVVDQVATNTTTITFVASGTSTPFGRKLLPSASPNSRFQVIPGGSHVVAYVCAGGQLLRTTRVLTTARGRPATCAAMTAGAATTAVLANNVARCSLVYDPPNLSTGLSRAGIVSISMGITDPSGESVNLYHQVHVDNTP